MTSIKFDGSNLGVISLSVQDEAMAVDKETDCNPHLASLFLSLIEVIG